MYTNTGECFGQRGVVAINNVRLFTVFVAALIVSSAFALGSVVAADQSGFSSWLSKVSYLLLGTGGTSTAVTGYQVSEGGTGGDVGATAQISGGGSVCPSKITVFTDKSKYVVGDATGTLKISAYDASGSLIAAKVDGTGTVNGKQVVSGEYNADNAWVPLGTITSGLKGTVVLTMTSKSGCPLVSEGATFEVVEASTGGGGGSAVSCPAKISVSSNKKTAYLQGETAIFTITMRDSAGNIVKRGASLGISSALDGSLKFGKAFPATDSGVVTVEVPLTAESYPPAAYAVQVSSDAGDCSSVSGGQSLSIEGSSGGGVLPGCIRQHPTVTISPESQEVSAGKTATYKVTITNNDNAACGSGVFYRWGTSDAGTAAVIYVTDEFAGKDLAAINPGGSLSYSMYALVSDSAKDGTYSVGEAVENTNAKSYSASASSKVVVKSSAALVPDIAVDHITIAPASYPHYAGNDLVAMVTIRNTGTATVECAHYCKEGEKSFPVTFSVRDLLPDVMSYSDGGTTINGWNDVGVMKLTATIPPMKPGESKSFNIKLRFSEAGEYKFVASAGSAPGPAGGFTNEDDEHSLNNWKEVSSKVLPKPTAVKPSCKTLGTLMYVDNKDGTGYIGCDVEVSGEFDLAKSYCISQKTYQKKNLVPDAYGRPNRYFNTLTGLDPKEAVRVYIASRSGELIECLPPLNYQETVTPSCTDSDGGKNYYVGGYVTASGGDIHKDFCDQNVPGRLYEQYCISPYSSNENTETYQCPGRCLDGACLSETATSTSCPSRIDFAFDKSSYNYGDSYYYKIATYDSKGNLVGADLDATVEVNGVSSGTSTLSTKPSGTYSTSGTISEGSGTYVITLKSKPYCKNLVSAVQKIVISGKPQTGNKGFSGAKWECYDGSSGGAAGSAGVCKTSDEWRKDAEVACSGRCSTAVTDTQPIKCGVNSFSVSGECSIDSAGCTDSDGGVNYYLQGRTYGLDREGSSEKRESYDYCVANNNLYEYYCDKNDVVGREFYGCQYGCKDGACLSSTNVDPEYYCPARIELYLDKDTYRVGEEGKLTIRTYNSKGQPQGYDVTGKVSGSGGYRQEYSTLSTKPSGIYATTGDINLPEGVYTFEVRQLQSCDTPAKQVSVSKTITIVPKEEPPEVPEGKYVYDVQIKKGWNLVSVLPLVAVGGRLGSSSTTCSWLQGDLSSGGAVESYVKKNMFSYDPRIKKYAALGELNRLPSSPQDGYLVNTQFNGFWLRSTEDCSVTMDFSSATSNNELFKALDQISNNNYKLVKGWNFFTVWPEMEGKTLDEVKGSCEVKRAYAYDQFSRKWTNLESVEFSRGAVSYGFVMKVADDCVLGGYSVIGLPPPLPEEEERAVAVAQRATLVAVAEKG